MFSFVSAPLPPDSSLWHKNANTQHFRSKIRPREMTHLAGKQSIPKNKLHKNVAELINVHEAGVVRVEDLASFFNLASSRCSVLVRKNLLLMP